MGNPLKNVFLFSGQGSQYHHMAARLFDSDPGFRSRMLEMDQVASDILGVSVLDQIYDQRKKRSDTLLQTAQAGVAIFMVEHALVQLLEEAGVVPDVVVSASLGIFAASCNAGCLSMSEAIRAIAQQARILEQRCPQGAMVAVFGDPALYRDMAQLNDRADLAGVNFSAHFTLSTPQAHLSTIEEFLRQEKISYSTLPVSLPFHSRWMDEARADLLTAFGRIAYRPPTRPLVCCAATGKLDALNETVIWNIVRQPIWFQRTIAGLEANGPHRYIDVGPSGTLATFLKYGLPPTSRSEVHTILSPFSNELVKLNGLFTLLRGVEWR
jgi:bacillaene synthase trans-acting acyltransferase